MKLETCFYLFNKLKNDQFGLAYMGEFDDELTTALLRVNEQATRKPRLFQRKVSFLMVECFQNILKHADKPELVNRTNNKPKMFLVRSVGDSFYIASTNLILNSKIAGLSSKLQSISSATKDELTTSYLQSLAKGKFSNKGGSGLGLIEMARKSDSTLEFGFEMVNYFFSVFFMQLKVNAPNPSEEEEDYAIALNDTKELYNSIAQENIIMLQKGDFSQQSILPVFELIRSNLDSDKKLKKVRKKILYILIELLQNICQHAHVNNNMREGIFIISYNEGTYSITTGNFIKNEEIDVLKNRLKNMVGLNKDGLLELYQNVLLKNDDTPHKGAGLGLIEVCRHSTEKLMYRFVTVSNTVSFFSITATI